MIVPTPATSQEQEIGSRKEKVSGTGSQSPSHSFGLMAKLAAARLCSVLQSLRTPTPTAMRMKGVSWHTSTFHSQTPQSSNAPTC